MKSPALLLLHGFPTSCYDWRGVIDHLSDRVRTIAPDLLGFGLSDKPVAYSYSLFQQADTIEALMAGLKVGAAHVVSHDLGTSLHSELLARQAEGRLGFEIATSTLLNGSMLQWLAKITPFQELLAANASLPRAIEVCRTMSTATYVPGLKKLMRRPEAISQTDAQVMNELLQYQDGNARLPALAGYMRERYYTPIAGWGRSKRRPLRCKSCGPTAIRSRTSKWAANWPAAVPRPSITNGWAGTFSADGGSVGSRRENRNVCLLVAGTLWWRNKHRL